MTHSEFEPVFVKLHIHATFIKDPGCESATGKMFKRITFGSCPSTPESFRDRERSFVGIVKNTEKMERDGNDSERQMDSHPCESNRIQAN